MLSNPENPMVFKQNSQHGPLYFFWGISGNSQHYWSFIYSESALTPTQSWRWCKANAVADIGTLSLVRTITRLNIGDIWLTFNRDHSRHPQDQAENPGPHLQNLETGIQDQETSVDSDKHQHRRITDVNPIKPYPRNPPSTCWTELQYRNCHDTQLSSEQEERNFLLFSQVQWTFLMFSILHLSPSRSSSHFKGRNNNTPHFPDTKIIFNIQFSKHISLEKRSTVMTTIMTRRYRKLQHNNTSHGSSDSTHTTTTNTLHLHALSRTDGQQATPAHPDVTLKRQRHRQRHRRQHRIDTGINDGNIHSCNASDIAYHRHRQRHLQQHHNDSGIYSSIASTAILAAASTAATDYKNIGIATTQMIKLTMSKQPQYCYWPLSPRRTMLLQDITKWHRIPEAQILDIRRRHHRNKTNLATLYKSYNIITQHEKKEHIYFPFFGGKIQVSEKRKMLWILKDKL